MKHITLACAERYVVHAFYADGKPLLNDAFRWGMTLKKAGSMQFRWDETNEARDALLQEIISKRSDFQKNVRCEIAPLELIHSKIVYAISCAADTYGLQGDGILTENARLMPVVTAADCMPIFFYERERAVFGVVHSGWKGTGIVSEAIAMIKKIYKGEPRNISVVLGAHIRNCCYIVDEERASYFKKNFCEDCVSEYKTPPDEKTKNAPLYASKAACARHAHSANAFLRQSGGTKRYRLSLEKANLFLLEKEGILDENIAVCDDCTQCDERFGSFRRESGGDIKKSFTVQAAFCGRLG